MTLSEYLQLYANGWTSGKAETVLKATSQDYTYDDPNSGVVARADFVTYMESLKETARARCGGTLPEPFMELSDVVTRENGGKLTAWCWWVIPGADLQGSGLIKVEAEGVNSEVVAYYSKLAR